MTIYDQPYQNKDQTWRFAHFEKLCQTGISIAVFCSRDVEPAFREEILEKYPNVLLFDTLDLCETQTYQTFMTVAQEYDIDLPNTRCVEKDTREYMLLMNSKTEFLHRVIQQNPFGSTHFAWIDFSIFYIFTGREEVCQKMLIDMSKRVMMPRFITMPGCWIKDFVLEYQLMNDICWRFCGGFFVGSADLMLEFHEKVVEHFKTFLQNHRRLVWEVNFWAYLELNHGLSIVWFLADHNEHILALSRDFLLPQKEESLEEMGLYSYKDSPHIYPK
jgi:hypothetical protein